MQIYIMFKINNGKILKTTKKSHYKGVVINILFVNTCIFLVTYHKCMYALWKTNEMTGLFKHNNKMKKKAHKWLHTSFNDILVLGCIHVHGWL